MVIAGPITAEQAHALAEAHFGAWSGGGAGHRSFTFDRARQRRLVLVDRPGSVQSEIRIGEISISRTDPSYFPTSVMAALLGGTFSSRLNQRLREDLGYTYGARAGLDPRRAPGPFVARAAVQTEVTAPAITEFLGLLEGMRSAPPPAEELRNVTDYLVGVFPLRFETTGGVAMAIEPIAVYGLSDDWWATYRDHVEAVTPEAIHTASLAGIHPDTALILLTGDAEVVEPTLAAAGFGPIEVVSPD